MLHPGLANLFEAIVVVRAAAHAIEILRDDRMVCLWQSKPIHLDVSIVANVRGHHQADLGPATASLDQGGQLSHDGIGPGHRRRNVGSRPRGGGWGVGGGGGGGAAPPAPPPPPPPPTKEKGKEGGLVGGAGALPLARGGGGGGGGKEKTLPPPGPFLSFPSPPYRARGISGFFFSFFGFSLLRGGPPENFFSRVFVRRRLWLRPAAAGHSPVTKQA